MATVRLGHGMDKGSDRLGLLHQRFDMALADNPFAVLSYVSGPALLTNATALLLLSTTNRFARAVDRSRQLAGFVAKLAPDQRDAPETREILVVGVRLRLIVFSLSSFYLAVAMFTLATLTSLIAAVGSEVDAGLALETVTVAAVVFGLIGFAALACGAGALVFESRHAMASLQDESAAAIATMERALSHPGS